LGSGGGPVAEPWEEFDWPEADQLFQRDRNWVGGDGGYSIDLGGGRVLWLFGDSWIDQEGGGSRKGAEMVSNSVAIQHGYDPSTAHADFYWGRDQDGRPGAFFPDVGDEKYWPGHGIRIDDGLLLFLMKVRRVDGGLGFAVTDWRAVMVENPDDAPSAWRSRSLNTPPSPEGIIVGSGSVLRVGEHVYAFGAKEPGPDHEVYLVRWNRDEAGRGELSDPEWWAGSDEGWTGALTGHTQPKAVFGGGQSEFTIHFDAGSGLFHEVQTDGFGAAAIVRRTASSPTGPWSPKDTVYSPPQGHFPRVLIYQGKAHPHLAGAELVLTYSTNSMELTDHLAEPWLYYPRFVRSEGR
jgi:hypothetical protein